MTAFTVAQVDASVTFPLRQQVLRPHQSLDELALPGDDDPDAGHFAAFAGPAVIGTASVRREPPPWSYAGGAWRLRGMASAAEWRSRGVGAAVLDAAVTHVASAGGGLLWCNARVPAVHFYERAGFRTRGEEWVDPEIGPHIVMHRTVDAP